MPDKRKHRGAHPSDAELFAASQVGALRAAVEDYSWLLTRGYAEDSALALVGNRHGLTDRQRMAVRRSACSDSALASRQDRRGSLEETGGRCGVDGYNLLITIESALSGGVILCGRDGCYRDLASVHGTYRKVEETLPALRLIVSHLAAAGAKEVDWYLDRPVSNSGRLAGLLREMLEEHGAAWNVELVDSPDAVLAGYGGVVVTSDSWILDRCDRWANVPAELIRERVSGAWVVGLG